ncbi:MAG: GNAT family N-acetyltransferase [Acidobacteriota bacterium]
MPEGVTRSTGFTIRLATVSDSDAISELIGESVRGLSASDYSPAEIEASIGTVFGVDSELIDDETYFVAESQGSLIGCGGWSRRKTLCGSSDFAPTREAGTLDPITDAAKIRAFFIHPNHARRGISSAILEKCEEAARAAGFREAEMMATLPGVRLYSTRGYSPGEPVAIPVGSGQSIECLRMRKKL